MLFILRFGTDKKVIRVAWSRFYALQLHQLALFERICSSAVWKAIKCYKKSSEPLCAFELNDYLVYSRKGLIELHNVQSIWYNRQYILLKIAVRLDLLFHQWGSPTSLKQLSFQGMKTMKELYQPSLADSERPILSCPAIDINMSNVMLMLR